MANKNRKIYEFFAKKISFFATKVYFDVPHAIGGAWAHFRRTHYWALSKRSSARSRRAMAVAPMFLHIWFFEHGTFQLVDSRENESELELHR